MNSEIQNIDQFIIEISVVKDRRSKQFSSAGKIRLPQRELDDIPEEVIVIPIKYYPSSRKAYKGFRKRATALILRLS